MIHVVIDTNVLVSALSSKSKYHKIITHILQGEINVYLTNEILFEYEEILSQKYSHVTSIFFINALKELPNVYFTEIYFRWNILKDEDDNKFTDCYIASPANFLITNDRGFKILETVTFPKVNCITIESFLDML